MRKKEGMWSVGMSIYCIARELDMDQLIVFTILENYHERDTVVACKPSRMLQKLSIHDKRDLGCIFT